MIQYKALEVLGIINIREVLLHILIKVGEIKNMKKLFLSIAVIVISLASLVTAVAASTDYKYKRQNQNFEKSYRYTYASGNVSFEYSPKSGALWWTEYASTRSGGFMKINEHGYLATTIVTVDGQTDSEYRGLCSANGGWEYCDKATVKGQKYAKHAEHYADFRTGLNKIDKTYHLEVD